MVIILKALEDFNQEYNHFSIQSNFIRSLEDFDGYIMVLIDDIEEEEKSLYQEIKNNRKQKRSASIRNMFPIFFAEEEVDFYDQDNAFLKEEIHLCEKYKSYFQYLKNSCLESHLLEFVQLLDYSVSYYYKNIQYLESLRDSLEYSLIGISFVNNDCENNIYSFDEFFRKKIEKFESLKSVEKVK